MTSLTNLDKMNNTVDEEIFDDGDNPEFSEDSGVSDVEEDEGDIFDESDEEKDDEEILDVSDEEKDDVSDFSDSSDEEEDINQTVMNYFKITRTEYDPIDTDKISHFVEGYNSIDMNISSAETENTYMMRKLLTDIIENNIEYYQRVVKGAMRTNTRLYGVEY